MSEVSPAAPPCAPLSGQHKGSFAYKTLTERLPVILTKTVDSVVRANYELAQQTAPDADAKAILVAKQAEAKQVIHELGRIRYEMQRDRELELLDERDRESDLTAWNAFLTRHFSNSSWFSAPWLVSECYMYRRIQSCFATTTHWASYDPYAKQKQDSLLHSVAAVSALAQRLAPVLSEAAKRLSDHALQREQFTAVLSTSLWGNRTDLSLLPNFDSSQAADLQAVKSSEDAHHHLVVNDTDQIWQRLVEELCDARVDIVLDNAGFELYGDLLLADWLLQSGRARTVHLHVKRIPWFVSDVTAHDLHWLLDALSNEATFGDACVHALVVRWREHLAAGRWTIDVDDFWTSAHAFWQLPDAAPQLWQSLSKSSLCIYKGDLNYRKLIYDCAWAPDTPFATAIGPLFSRADAPPTVALRTCKADLIVGVAAEKAASLTAACPEWLVNGEYAVIQFALPASK